MSRALRRIVGILDRFSAQRTSLSPAEVADLAGPGRATAFRFLGAREQEHLVRRDQVTTCYALGSKLMRWGAMALGSVDARAAADPIMYRLNRETEETIGLNIRDGNQRICVATYESRHPVRYVLLLGNTPRIAQAAGDHAMLAARPEVEATMLVESDPLLGDADRYEIHRVLPSL